ncbi:hypothetical protein [Prauserella alba]|uniref:DUF4350 domain-containing protein n=1 Tax=Prauserella alba TaxID=176898 RepID=A0ABN1V3Q3_9PSEU|nr:hypothetical protein [Prauserella alba]MCP2180292.1 hypothetical protein [Prauserella alba]
MTGGAWRTGLRWLIGVLLVGGAVFSIAGVLIPLLAAPDEPSSTTSIPEADRAIDGLRERSVYVESGDGAEWRLDVPAARELIGDRPILVAGFAGKDTLRSDAPYFRDAIADVQRRPGALGDLAEYDGPMEATCAAIAGEYPDTMVVVLHPRPGFETACAGPGFPAHDSEDEPVSWADGVLASASGAGDARTGGADRLPLVEGLVPAYETGIERFDAPPVERDLAGPFRALRISAYVVGGAVAAAALFLLVRHGVTAGGASVGESRRGRRAARASAQADVHALADRVLALERDQADRLLSGSGPPDPAHVLRLAEGYLDLARRIESAETTEQYAEISRLARSLLDPDPDPDADPDADADVVASPA